MFSVDVVQQENGRNRGWCRADGIIQLVVGDAHHEAGALYGKEDAIAAADLVARLAEGRKDALVLTDMRRLRKTSSAARRVPTYPDTLRLALVVSSPVGRMLGNAYIGIIKPDHETRLFTDEAQAVAWLKPSVDESGRSR